MGCFSFTCAISGLPIDAGDKVRYCLLTEGPYPEERKHHIHDEWAPRTWPLRAVYNDYGSVEKVEKGAAKDAWMDGFRFDAVTKGWGENQSHDVATSKKMTWSTLLYAIWEGRLSVRRIRGFSSLDPDIVVPEPMN
jgi:hypothetical protein